MSWAQTLLDASYGGLVFEVVKTDDSAERAVVEHSYPYVDGSDVEDMGRGARKISIEAVFYGDDYEIRLQAFLAKLDEPEAQEFIHPVFGSIKQAQVTRSSVHHDAENPDFASLVVDFTESTPGNPFFDRSLPVQLAESVPQHGALAVESASSAAAALIERLRSSDALAGLDTLRETLTAPLLAIVAQSGVVLSGLDVLAYPRAWGNDIAALVGGLLDVRDFGAGLMSDWAGIQSDLNAFSIFSTPPVVAGAQPVAQVQSGGEIVEVQAVHAAAATVQVNVAVGLANAVGFVLASEAATPTLSPIEIEAVANTARSAIETAIEQVRAIYGIEYSRTITEPLKGQGLAVQEAARAVIVARPPLIQRVVDAPGNLRLMAHLLYADHDRAPELYRLNSARSPFVMQGEVINAYAR